MEKIVLAFLMCLMSFNVFSLSQKEMLEAGFVYPNSDLHKSGVAAAGERLLIESAVKRIDNSMSIEDKRIVNSLSHFSLYKLSGNTNLQDVYLFYKDALENKGSLSYGCVKRECGINNYWANKIFSNSELKGRDSAQYYLAGKYSVKGVTYFVSVYVVSNFLRKNLVRVEFVPLTGRDEAKGSAGIYGWQQGYLLSGVDGTAQLIDKLKLFKGLNVVEIVAFTKNDRIVSTELQIDINKSMSKVKTSIMNGLSDDVEVKGFVVGHRNIESVNIDSEVWFRVFAY